MTQRLTDAIDIASREAERANNEAIAAQQMIAAKALKPNSITNCIDCDDNISPERKQAAPWAIRCADCQDIQERKEAQHG